MRRLVFIDDDKSELQAFGEIVSGAYDYTAVHWPRESAKLLTGLKPDIFVSDLYLPSPSGDRVSTETEKDKAREAAQKTGERFFRLYTSDSQDDKARLRETMEIIADAYALLRLQWSALGQSPDYGVAVFAKVKAQYPEVPFVFYSRKITPEDVIRVLKAGAIDAIRKGALTKYDLLVRLKTVQEIYRRGDVQTIRTQGMNVNLTSIPTN
jgi:DNA-binding NarL/FixJ family response regulator